MFIMFVNFHTNCCLIFIISSRRNEKKSHVLLPAAGGPCKRTLYKTLCLMVFHPPNHETIFVAEF